MLAINKKFITDEAGNLTEVIISLDDYRRIEEILGLDLNEETIADLRKAQRDRESGKQDAYIDLDAI